MSLDQNLFTLTVTPVLDSPLVLELIDPHGTVYYRKERTQTAQGGPYEFKLIEPLSESLLATVTAPSASSKHKTIELHNPSVPVELKYTGILSFKWLFKWEQHDFEWKKEECYLIRKPDPPVLVAITKEPSGKIKTKSVQVLDYNLKRFDIDDRKGLEIVILSALLSFQDYSDEVRGTGADTIGPPLSGTPAVKTPRSPENVAPPELPPKPRKTGVELIADSQIGTLGEVIVEAEGEIKDYARYCANLLERDDILFVVLRSSNSATVPKVLEIAHQTKRIRHREGLDEDGELYQYVRHDTHNTPSLNGKRPPRVIKLDDDTVARDKYKPPESLTVHLSKIELPELQPKWEGKAKQVDIANDEERKRAKGKGKAKETDGSDRERRRREKEREKELMKKENEGKKGKGREKDRGRARSLDRDDRGHAAAGKRLTKPTATLHVPSHMVHPNQPSPSPSQLNNPAIYAAPTPRPPPVPTLMVPSPPFGSYAIPPGHHRTVSAPGIARMDYPQRPISAYGAYLGPPQPPPQQQRPQSPSSVVSGLLGKLKTW